MKDHIVRRYAVFLCGMIAISFGVATITKADLGTSPITSIPYSLSLILPQLTFGNWTILFSLLQVLIQLLLLGKDADKTSLAVQVVICFVFGYFVDFAMMVMGWWEPDVYALRILSVVVGCFILAMGVYLQLVANVAMVPGDGMVYALKMRLRWEYGKVRLTNDMSLVSIAIVISLACLGTLGGVREGTFISALSVGLIARLYLSRFERLSKALIPEDTPQTDAAEASRSFLAHTVKRL